MKIAFLTITCLLLSIHTTHAQRKEKFDTFFERFSGDAIFQKSRINFPLRIITVDENNNTSVKLIFANKWQFTNFHKLKKSKKNIFKIKYITNNQTKVIYQQEDTGINITHLYKLVNNKWLLIEIKDTST